MRWANDRDPQIVVTRWFKPRHKWTVLSNRARYRTLEAADRHRMQQIYLRSHALLTYTICRSEAPAGYRCLLPGFRFGAALRHQLNDPTWEINR